MFSDGLTESTIMTSVTEYELNVIGAVSAGIIHRYRFAFSQKDYTQLQTSNMVQYAYQMQMFLTFWLFQKMTDGILNNKCDDA